MLKKYYLLPLKVPVIVLILGIEFEGSEEMIRITINPLKYRLKSMNHKIQNNLPELDFEGFDLPSG